MFSRIGQTIFDNEAVAKTSDFHVGFEVEMDRADEFGHLSTEPYPNTIGDEKTNPWITNDFLEAMSEIVTPPANSADEAAHYLYRINITLRTALAPGEILWPLSMPPIFPKVKDERLFAKTYPSKIDYLKKYIKKYSFTQGSPCGIHVNFSINDHIIDLVYKHFQNRFKNKAEVKTYLYLKIGQGFIRYRWLITYLFGASPVAQANYFDSGNVKPKHPVRSMRQSDQYGYGGSGFFANYTNLDTYVQSIKQGVKDKKLIRIEQGQGPVRFKGSNDLDELQKQGIKYVELRMLDLDPNSSVGIRTTTIRFLRLMATYFIMSTGLKESEVDSTLRKSNEMNNNVALESPDVCTYQVKALTMINELEDFVDTIQVGPEYQEILQDMEFMVKNPNLTVCGQLANHIKDGSLVDYGIKLGKRYQNGAHKALRPFRGFEDNSQMSADELKQYILGDIENV
ncbi:glutamate--cysteine ligase [Lactobacillaceae bacterium Melli_B3]